MSRRPVGDPRPGSVATSVSSDLMQEPAGHGADDDPDAEPTPTTARTWVHPSELGLENRRRSDRRRGTVLAAALVLGGVSLLTAVAVMGLGSGSTPATARSTPEQAVAATLASLTVVDGGAHRTVTGVVIDDDGHVAVRAGAVEGADEIWASCGGRQPELVEVVGHDPTSDLAVIALPEGSGRPVVADSTVATGDEVILARAGAGEAAPSISSATIDADAVTAPSTGAGTPLIRIAATSDARPTSAPISSTSVSTASSQLAAVGSVHSGGADGAVFDPRGRFVGLVVQGDPRHPELLPAEAVLEVALALAR